MLKKIMPLLIIATLFLLYVNVTALPTVESITMCEYIQVTEPDGPVICQNEIDPPVIGTLDEWSYFDIVIPDMTADDIIVINLYNAEGGLDRQDDYEQDDLTGDHLIYSVDVGSVEEYEEGLWNITIFAVDPGQDLVELDFFEFAIEYEETQPCEDFGRGYSCCESPLACPRGNRIAAGTCESGTCCDAEANCQETISGMISRTEINCADAGLQDCNRVVGSLYNYSIHGPLDHSAVIELEVRDIDISCFDKTDVAIGYYDEANKKWIELASYVTEVFEGTYEVSALIDYLGYVGVIKTGACVEVSCTAGGYQFEPTSGYIDVDETIKFKICGLVPGCDATEDEECDEQCPEGMDPDCTSTSCSNSDDGCCLISKDDVCDPDCDSTVDPDCCDKAEDGCCPGDSQRSGSQGCDINCGLGDMSCTECTATVDDCCYPASDGVCDLDCSPMKPDGGNPDPDCAIATSATGDACNPVADGTCDRDCIFGTDPDCRGGYIEYCGNGKCGDGEGKAETGDCEEDEVLHCGWTGGGTPCEADCGTACWCEVWEPGGESEEAEE